MKGMFTQGLVVLMERPVRVEELRACLPEFPFLRVVPAGPEWAMGGETAIVGFRPEVNGLVAIDCVDRAWPDDMGDPKEEPMIFGAWSMGHFGPLTYPGGLQRAVQQAWSWPEAKALVPRHTAFVRLRLSYIFGGGPDAKVMPPDCDPRAELGFLTELVRGVLRHPATICFFSPGGEVIATAAMVERHVDYHREHKLPPLNVWTNVRLFNLPGDWLMMDSVGNWQLDIADHEAAFPKGAFDPADVDPFIRNATLYVLTKGDVIKHGDTMEGPGNVRWQAARFENGLCDPPREVICWVPLGSKNIPAQITARPVSSGPASSAASAPPAKVPWWKRWRGQ